MEKGLFFQSPPTQTVLKINMTCGEEQSLLCTYRDHLGRRSSTFCSLTVFYADLAFETYSLNASARTPGWKGPLGQRPTNAMNSTREHHPEQTLMDNGSDAVRKITASKFGYA